MSFAQGQALSRWRSLVALVAASSLALGILAPAANPFSAEAAYADGSGGGQSAPWSVSLTADKTTFAAGESVTLTATANQSITPGGPFRIHFFDATTGSRLDTCSTSSTCSLTSVPFVTGGPRQYVAVVAGGGIPSSYGQLTDLQATSNVVTLERQSWSVSLTADRTTFAAGESVTLTATANQTMVPGGPYQIHFFDTTTGNRVDTCSTSSTCSVTWVPFTTGGPRDYVAIVSGGSSQLPYTQQTDVQATSNVVTLERQSWSVTLTADKATFAAGESVTLTAKANQSVTPGGLYWIHLFDTTTGSRIDTCVSGPSCSLTFVPFLTGDARDYVAVVAGGGTPSSYGQLTDLQATSNVVTLERQSWSVSLTADKTTFAAGESVRLTATANQSVTPSGPHWIHLFDATTGNRIDTCVYGSSCSLTSVPFLTGGPRDYVAVVSGGSNPAGYGQVTDLQATSNVVTLERQSWSVSLTADKTTFAAGESVTLTATANQSVTPGGPFQVHFFDTTTGNRVDTCSTSSTCSVTWVPFYSGAAHDYVAVVSAGGANSYGQITDLQATSNVVRLARAPWSISLAGSSVRNSSQDPASETVTTTFTATANQDVADTLSAYVVYIVDYSTGQIVRTCSSGSTCSVDVTESIGSPTHMYFAAVAASDSGRFDAFDLQATSQGFSADLGTGGIYAQERVGCRNPAQATTVCGHADPVDASTGEFSLGATDLELEGAGPSFVIARTYAASLRQVDGPFGYGWSPAFESRLEILQPAQPGEVRPRQVQIVQENGAVVVFNADPGGGYVSSSRTQATLVFNGEDGEWVFTRRGTFTFTFDMAEKLKSVADLHGNAIAFDRDTSGRVVEMTASGGRSFEVTWSGSRIDAITDSTGRVVDYNYDASGNLVSVTGADGEVTTYGYDAARYMTQVVKPGGATTSNTFDSTGRVLTQTDPAGRVTTFAYNGSTTTITDPGGLATVEVYDLGRLMSQTIAAGTPIAATTTYQYDIAGNVVATTDALGNITTSTFDGSGNRLSTTDPLGRTTTWTYDALGNPLSVTDPLGRTTSATYSAKGNRLTLTSPSGAVQSWAYSPAGVMVSHTDQLGNVTQYAIDARGQTTQIADPMGRTATFQFDGEGRLTSSANGLGNATLFSYDTVGRLEQTTDPLGAETGYTYDIAGNLTATTDALGAATAVTYNPVGQPLTTTDALGRVTTSTYNAAGLLASVTSPDGKTVSFAYDPAGRRTSVTDPLGRVSSTGYDLIGRPVSTTTPSGATSTVTYDAAGQIVSATDALGNTSTIAYDAAGQRTSMTDALGRVTTYSYDLDGRVVSVQQPDGSVLATTYDAAGRVLTVTDADSGVTTYGYDASGMRTSRIEPGGRTTTTTYDQAGRPTVVTLPDQSTRTATYDAAGRLTSIDASSGPGVEVVFAYDALGRRTGMTDATGVTATTYDAIGRLVAEVNGSGVGLGYTYDIAGNLASITYPGGQQVAYEYDAAGQLVGVTDPDAGEFTFEWTPDGYLASQSAANGVERSSQYDAIGQLTQVQVDSAAGVIDTFTYGFDAGSRLTSATTAARASTYGYDLLDQLASVSVTPSGGAVVAGDYTVTPNGRITGTPDGESLAYGSSNELVSLTGADGAVTSYSYNGLGARTLATTIDAQNVTTTTGFAYDALGALEQVDLNGTQTVSYTADGSGLRQSRQVDAGAVEQFVWSTVGAYPLLLDDGAHRYVYGADATPLAQIDDAGVVTYLHTDSLGTPTVFTDTSGAVVGTARFDEFGVPVEATGVPSRFGFTGNWTDPVTGFVYLRARDYDPQTRQFFRVDPALDLTGQPYAYAGNNPLTVTDPLGLFGFEALGSWFDQVTASAYHGLKSGPGVAVTSFVVGFGDSISFGLAEAARESLAPGSSCQVVKDGFYSAGGLASSFVPIPGLGVAAAAFKVGAVAVAGAATVVIKAIPAAVTAAKGLPKALIGGTVMAAKTTTKVGGKAGDVDELTTVGRWMGGEELAQMQATGRVVEGGSGRTYVVNPADPGAFAAGVGNFVTFAVPRSSLKPAGRAEWNVIPGPNVTTRIYGPPPAEMPRAACITLVCTR